LVDDAPQVPATARARRDQVRIATALVLVLAGCYAPTPQPGAPCSSSGECPQGLVCSPASTTCELRAIDAGHPDAPPRDAPDAAIDAAPDVPIDAAPLLPVLVQEVTGFSSTGNSLSVTLPAAPIAGHVLMMIGGDPQSGLDSVSGGGATWTLATRSTAEANVEVWTGVTNGSSSTVTIALAGNVSTFSMAVSEWANLASTNLVDVTSIGNAPGSPATAGSITSTGAPELVLFGAGAFGTVTWGTPSGGPWIPMMSVTSSVSQAVWYRVATTTGTFAPSVTESGTSWDAALVALRAAP
jgi:hypothetical protein